ncbi:hypothetical protein HPB48_026785 [Haemaphysalis longicornis]|uniref:Uncharacterized protein n=1 Tax=Haemaphysalis longicornis TaxID=44386 RepID=A0A9J6HBM0_HAELO|nr:hypothetical protein HPB48_026785 [Haemaphysalis longicornis]
MKIREEHPHAGVKETCSTTRQYTGVSLRKILDIKSKAKATGGKLTTPLRGRPRRENRKRLIAMYDGFALYALRNIVHDLFRRNGTPTAQKIAEQFGRSEHLPSLRTWAIRRLLSYIGFIFQKRERNSMMIERQDVLIWRREAENVAPNNWAKAVEHVIGIEDKCREACGFSNHAEPLIISLGEEDDDSCGSADDDLSGIEQTE